ncbi:MAG TPA: sigma-70 family RNA polymerase sigma factor [Pseudonocardiaceae bacterium]|nr:sigma-70 family RNA polymerase sigma factor [Pseudonocardiaceae bacterium]
MTDDDVVTGWALAAAQGDRDAAAAFIRATTGHLRRLFSYLADPGQADDLVQETYLRAFTALPRYANRSPARLWLLSIARRVAADQVRGSQRGPRRGNADWQAELDRVRPVADVSEGTVLRQAIAALDDDRREAFVLTRVMGLSYEEAAQACGCPVGTIRSRVFRARADLLTALGEQEDPATGIGP